MPSRKSQAQTSTCNSQNLAKTTQIRLPLNQVHKNPPAISIIGPCPLIPYFFNKASDSTKTCLFYIKPYWIYLYKYIFTRLEYTIHKHTPIFCFPPIVLSLRLLLSLCQLLARYVLPHCLFINVLLLHQYVHYLLVNYKCLTVLNIDTALKVPCWVLKLILFIMLFLDFNFQLQNKIVSGKLVEWSF